MISFQTSPNLETYNHLLRIRINDNRLRSGMLAKAKFILPKIEKSFGVPVASVLSDNGKKFVFIINGKKLQKRKLTSLQDLMKFMLLMAM